MGRLKFLHPTLEELFNSYCSPSQPHMSGRHIVLAAILLHQCPGLRQRRGKLWTRPLLLPVSIWENSFAKPNSVFTASRFPAVLAP